MTEEHRKIFEQYLKDEKQRGHTEQGFIDLKIQVPKVISYLEEMDLKVCRMGLKQAQGFQKWLIETGRIDGGKYEQNTIASYTYAAVNFYEHLLRCKIVPVNPFKEIKRIRPKKIIPKNLLKEKELSAFLEKLSVFDEEEGNTNYQNVMTRYKVHVIAELMYSTGLRISEIASLEVDDIDFIKGIVNVKHGKGCISRIAFLNEYTKEILRLYINRIRPHIFTELNEKNGKLLFGAKSEGLGVVLNNTLRKWAKEMGHGRFTSHKFRHQVGFHLLRAGCNIRHIQQILGHQALKTTEIYTKVDKEDLRDVLDEFHPRKWRDRNEQA